MAFRSAEEVCSPLIICELRIINGDIVGDASRLNLSPAIKISADAAKIAGIAVLLCLGLNGVRAGGTAMSSGDSSEALSGLQAPDSPERPWQPPNLGGSTQLLQTRDEPQTDAQK